MNEEAVQQSIRLDAADFNSYLWRNNVGALPDHRGVPVRYGLANDSAKLNKEIKSSDLIGITPVIIQSQHVGMMLGVFTAVEVKHPGWNHGKKLTEHEQAQLNYINLVRQAGGFAGFANSIEDYRKIIGVR